MVSACGPSGNAATILCAALLICGGRTRGASAPRRQSSETRQVDRQRSVRKRSIDSTSAGTPCRLASGLGDVVFGSNTQTTAEMSSRSGTREEPGLEEAPVPGGGGPREQQDEEVALGQAVLDLPVPVRPGRDVDAGHEALDLRAERLEGLLDGDGERVVLVLVADEDPEAVVRDARHIFPSSYPDRRLRFGSERPERTARSTAGRPGRLGPGGPPRATLPAAR